MKKLQKLLVVLSLIVLLIGGGVFFYYTNSLKAVDASDETEIIFEVKEGSYLNTVLDDLEKQGLIHNALMAKVYTKLNGVSSFKFGNYRLNKTMDLKEIFAELEKGSTFNPDQITVTFREGLNITQYLAIIEDNFSIDKEAFKMMTSSEEFLLPLIEKYWFLTDEILNDEVYYPLEGYLTPNTYAFTSIDADAGEIVETMLDQLDSVLTPHKDDYMNHEIKTIHQLLTLASIVELEAVTTEDREGVSGVFMNRLEDNTVLGSDVTTYYGVGVLMSERDLYQYEIDDKNAYNTRNSVVGLPIGPVSNPSADSIVAAINYRDDNAYFFVSDKNRKIYFTETYADHIKLINRLKEEGLWFVW